jgi:hypothetical protein
MVPHTCYHLKVVVDDGEYYCYSSWKQTCQRQEYYDNCKHWMMAGVSDSVVTLLLLLLLLMLMLMLDDNNYWFETILPFLLRSRCRLDNTDRMKGCCRCFSSFCEYKIRKHTADVH